MHACQQTYNMMFGAPFSDSDLQPLRDTAAFQIAQLYRKAIGDAINQTIMLQMRQRNRDYVRDILENGAEWRAMPDSLLALRQFNTVCVRTPAVQRAFAELIVRETITPNNAVYIEQMARHGASWHRAHSDTVLSDLNMIAERARAVA